MEVRLERRRKQKGQEISVETMAHAPAIGIPSPGGFTKTKLADCKVKIICKTKIKKKPNPGLGWFRGLNDYHVLNSLLYTLGLLPMIHRPGTQAVLCLLPAKYLFQPSSQVHSETSNIFYPSKLLNNQIYHDLAQLVLSA